MASLPTGIDLPNPPSPTPASPSPTVVVPAFWNDTRLVLERVFSIAQYDPEAAAQIWREYKRLTNQ